MPPRKGGPRPRRPAPARALENLQSGVHALVVLATPAAKAAALVALARGGLDRHDKVVIVVPSTAFMEHVALLQKLSTLEGPREFSGQFALLPEEEILREAARAGTPGDPRAFVEDYCRRALREGWRGIRLAHIAGDGPGRAQWEALWDRLVRTAPVAVVCAYPHAPARPGAGPLATHRPILGLSRAFPAGRADP